MDSTDENIELSSKPIRDHWTSEVFALELLNGVSEEEAASEESVADKYFLFDKPAGFLN